jgi:hypothetical protein
VPADMDFVRGIIRVRISNKVFIMTTFAKFIGLVIFAFWSISAQASCRDCNGGVCGYSENGYVGCTNLGCKMEGETEVCRCRLTGGQCLTAFPIPSWWPGFINPPAPPSPDYNPYDFSRIQLDIRKGTPGRKSLLPVSERGLSEKDRTLALLVDRLAGTHPSDIVEALADALTGFVDDGVLPDVLEVATRNPSKTGTAEHIEATRRYSITAQDKSLQKSPVFEIQLLSENGKKIGDEIRGDAYRFSLSGNRLQALPRLRQN